MLLLVEKPIGPTSFWVIKKLKRIFFTRKAGHAGTLDPLASGLLIIATDEDTKKLSQFVWLDKVYETTIDLAQRSDTRDTQFRSYHEQLPFTTSTVMIDAIERPIPTHEQVVDVVQSLVGTHAFPLTPFSAKKRKGKKLYTYAREGNPVHIDMVMEVFSAEVLSYTFPEVCIRFHVGSGTYIRSLAHVIGTRLGMGGIVTQLHRSAIGKYALT